MVVNDTFRTKKPSIGSVYGFYAKPPLLAKKIEDGIEPYMRNTEHPQKDIVVYIVRFNTIELLMLMLLWYNTQTYENHLNPVILEFIGNQALAEHYHMTTHLPGFSHIMSF